MTTEEKIKHLAKLDSDWDGRDGVSTPPELVDAALKIAAIFSDPDDVFLLNEGHPVLQWHESNDMILRIMVERPDHADVMLTFRRASAQKAKFAEMHIGADGATMACCKKITSVQYLNQTTDQCTACRILIRLLRHIKPSKDDIKRFCEAHEVQCPCIGDPNDWTSNDVIRGGLVGGTAWAMSGITISVQTIIDWVENQPLFYEI